MSTLAKLNVQSVTRVSKQDPIQQRRRKLVAGIEERMKVAGAALKGESYEVKRNAWVKNEHGEKVLVERQRKVRAWFLNKTVAGMSSAIAAIEHYNWARAMPCLLSR